VRHSSIRPLLVLILVLAIQKLPAFVMSCDSTLEDVGRLYQLRTETPYMRWLGSLDSFDPRKENFALTLGFYDLPATLNAQAARRAIRISETEAITLRSFEAQKKFPNKRLLPPGSWHNRGHFKGFEGLTSSANAFFAMDKALTHAENSGHKGPLFVFFLDDLSGGHRYLSKEGSQLREDDLMDTDPLYFSDGKASFEEGHTEAELRLILARPRFLERTVFYLKGEPLNLEQARAALGRSLQHFPHFDSVYKP
jgi:hypothetical protein